jgi:hypothetical protein
VSCFAECKFAIDELSFEEVSAAELTAPPGPNPELESLTLGDVRRCHQIFCPLFGSDLPTATQLQPFERRKDTHTALRGETSRIGDG